jgi:hypothetical protein
MPIRRVAKGAAKKVEPEMDATEVHTVVSTPKVVEIPVVQEVVETVPVATKPLESTASGNPQPASAEIAVAKPAVPVTPAETTQLVALAPTVAAVVDNKEPVAMVESGPEEIQSRDVTPVHALPECRLAGPYNDEVKATKKVVTLRRAGLNVDIKSVPSSIFSGYMIATAILPNRAEAKALVARLKAAGVTDYYVPRKRSSELRVSLGIYNGKKIAQREIKKLAKKGFSAELLPWKKKGTQHFLVIRGEPSAVDGKLMADLPVPDGENESTDGFCHQLAGR